jgi:aarF domain-containing kinase
MRGGALKIGQILSTSEESVLPPVIRDAMEKARSEADIMPLKQVTKNLIREYGHDWQKNFHEINLYPFAAASIGQVHEAILKDGTRVALKMQYTGIANSIDSDLNNFKRIADILGIFPRGLYINEALDVARRELHWECDYTREASYQRAYREHLLGYPKDFYCPQVVDQLSTKSILCSEFVDGREIDTFVDSSQEERDRIGALLISLCFKELFEFKMMQTDPNPANYLFDQKRNILNLLDLGAGRDFGDGFLDAYMQVIWGAYKDDREAILHHSRGIGFLTGDENKEMLNAHYTGTMIVGEPFRTEGDVLYDFGSAGLTEKVYKILPTMSKHRLTPPPEEVYSLHKKIIGTYLMCIKLKARVPAKQILEETYANWKNLHGKQYRDRQ